MSEAGFYPSRKLKKRGNEYFAYWNLWPFLGVIIVLFVLLSLITAPANICTRGNYPLVPVARNGVLMRFANREDAMHLYITRDGSIYFNNAKVVAEDLAGHIRESVKNRSERRVYLEIDARVRYGDVKEALDGVRDARIENVALLVQ